MPDVNFRTLTGLQRKLLAVKHNCQHSCRTDESFVELSVIMLWIAVARADGRIELGGFAICLEGVFDVGHAVFEKG